jgi:hypothetical protein
LGAGHPFRVIGYKGRPLVAAGHGALLKMPSTILTACVEMNLPITGIQTQEEWNQFLNHEFIDIDLVKIYLKAENGRS